MNLLSILHSPVLVGTQDMPELPPEAAGAIAAMGAIWLLFMLGMIVLFVLVWWKIFSKAGHSGALSLLIFIPLVGLIVLLWFAFSDWPVQKELRSLRRRRGDA